MERTGTLNISNDESRVEGTHQRKSAVVQPNKSLRAFLRIELQPGETTHVTFSLPASQLACYDTPSRDCEVGPGTFDILVSDSSDDRPPRRHAALADKSGSTVSARRR